MLLEDMAKFAGLTVVNGIHHQFNPSGVTALLLVMESHLSIHTWPQFYYATFDVVSCKVLSPMILESLKELVRARFHCSILSGKFVLRGGGNSTSMQESRTLNRVEL